MRVRAWAKLHTGRVRYRRVRSESHTLHALFGAVEHVLRQLAARVGLLEVHLKMHVQRERVDVLELECPEQRPSAVARPVRRKVVVLDEDVDEPISVAGRGRLPDGGERRRVLAAGLGQQAREREEESEEAHHGRSGGLRRQCHVLSRKFEPSCAGLHKLAVADPFEPHAVDGRLEAR